LGLSALAGSLVAVSAQAGEMAVSGSANVTYKTGKTANSSKSIGADKDVAFTGTGELDNGWSFVFKTVLDDAYDVSSSYTALTMGSLGTFTFGTGTGGVGASYDEETPQVYEQVSDSLTNSQNIVGDQMGNNAIMYASPSYDIMGAAINFGAEFSPQASNNAVNDGGSVTYSPTIGAGIGLGITGSMSGVTVGVYGNTIENTAPVVPGVDAAEDSFEGTYYVKYATGPVSIGYQMSHLDAGKVVAAEATTVAKVVRTAGGIFEAETMSIAYNVNDDLSVSYSETEDEYNNEATTALKVKQKTDAFQVAYSMGSMSIKAYKMETKNPGYDSDAEKLNVTEIALGLAF